MEEKYSILRNEIVLRKSEIIYSIYEKVELINEILQTSDKEVEDEMMFGILIRGDEYVDYVIVSTKTELFIGKMCSEKYIILESYIPISTMETFLRWADYMDLYETYERLVAVEKGLK